MKPTPKQKNELNRLKKLDSGFEFSWNYATGVPLRLRGKLTAAQKGDPTLVTQRFLKDIKALYDFTSPEDELRLEDVSKDKAGNTHLKYQQMVGNYPVFGHELRVHIDKNNIITGVNGRFFPKIQAFEKNLISSEKAVNFAINYDPKNSSDKVKGSPVLVVFITEKKIANLVWQIIVEGKDKSLSGNPTPATWVYFIDSKSGEILWRYNNEPFHTFTIGNGVGEYSGNVSIDTMHDHSVGNYLLEDGLTGTLARIFTHDANGGWPPAAISVDADNNWNANNQQELVDCHLYTRMVFDYFLTNHSRNSYDNAGAAMHIYAHCGANWNNASWNGSFVKIGDGDGLDYNSLCSLDMVAHEWTHAVTEFTANLIYYNQSGALNESMSDVFAALIDGDWLHGEDCWLRTTAPASRNLQDPTNGGLYDPANPSGSVLDGHQPDHMNDIYTGSWDNGGVHINSGIMNKAAFLIATGGSHRGINVCEGLGRQILGELYYHALINHLTSSSDFDDMRNAVLDSLDDLYQNDAHYYRWKASIKNAFAAVGVGSAVRCPKICWVLPKICPPSPDRLCPPAPDFICPPSPHLECPPSPRTCVLAPRPGCLPGPDPVFNPEIIVRPPELDLDKIQKISKVHIDALNKIGINTVYELKYATNTPNKIKELSRISEISVAELKILRTEALKLLRQ